MEDSISIDSTIEGDPEYIIIKISDLHPLHCNKQRLIESSDYFEALVRNGGFKEGILGCVNFSLTEWREEYYTFFSWLSSGTDLLKVLNTRCLLFFIIFGNYFQLKPQYFKILDQYAGNINILDQNVQTYLMNYWSYRYIPFTTMTTMILSNQSSQGNQQLVKLVLAWLDEKSFEDRRALESSEQFHQVRAFLKTVSSWIPTNVAEFMGIIADYPYAAQVFDVTSLFSTMKAVCFCTRFTPTVVFKYV